MNIKNEEIMTFEEVKKDYLAIIKALGYPYDMTGGFEDAIQMEPVILSPTKTNAKNYMIKVIRYGFEDGDYWNGEFGKILVGDCPIAKRVYFKYCS